MEEGAEGGGGVRIGSAFPMDGLSGWRVHLEGHECLEAGRPIRRCFA